MAIKLIGQANHVHDDGSISMLSVNVVEVGEEEQGWVNIKEENDGPVLIHSKEQGDLLKALIDKAIDSIT